MNQITDTAERIGGDARDEIAALRSKVETLMQDRVTPALSALAQDAEGAARSAGDAMKVQVNRVTDGVKEKPLIALAIAAAVGFALAALLRR